MSLKFTQKITLDLTIPRIQNVRCVQDDKKSRIINIVVTNDGKPYKITNTMIVSYKVFKADSNYVWNKKDVVINDDGSVTIDLSEQAVAFVGIAKSSLKIQENEQKISTLPFNIIVEKAVVSDDVISSIIESDIIDDFESHLVDFNNPHKVTKSQVGLGNVENKSSATIRGEITKSNVTIALGYTPLNQSLKGSASGLAELDSNGKVPSSQLPSYVDDVVEGYLSSGKFYKESAHTTEISGETGKIYIDLSTEKTYRWSGSAFVVISETLALGETSSTAYRGDRGKIAYDHSQSAHAPSNAEVNQNAFSNVVVGSTTVAADSKTDTLELVGDNVEITPDADSNKIIFKATTTEITNNHINNKSNPHEVTKAQVGLENVPNVATNDQTPTYTVSTSNAELTSGEKLSVAFGKIAKAVSTLISHISTSASTSVLGHVKYGTTSGTACQGNDSRLSDSRTPKSHASTGTGYGAGTTSNYGHVKLSDSSAVTSSKGLALPATEKNASIKGTLANQISALSTDLAYEICHQGNNYVVTKNGNTLIIDITGLAFTNGSVSGESFIIPTEFYPKNTKVVTGCSTTDDNSHRLTLETDGKLYSFLSSGVGYTGQLCGQIVLTKNN